MYQVYIRHFISPAGWSNPGAMHEEEHLMYELPGNYPENEVLSDAKVKTEMGKAGSFEFTMEQDNPWYASLNQMTTLIRVKYDGETIFYGRVLAIETDMWGKRKAHCEGALAFLLDTMVEATKEESRLKISLATYVKNLIDSHNNVVANEPNKKFRYGEIPGYYSASVPDAMKPDTDNIDRKYGTGSWTSTMNCLDELSSRFGGYWRARYTEEVYTDTIGQWGQGNIDLNNRIVIHNPDGTISTEKSFSTEINDKSVLLPTIIGGTEVSKESAIQHYEQTGEYLGIFDTVQECVDYADALNERQNWYYTGQGLVHRLYLDWLKDMFNPITLDQPVEIAENVVDMNYSVDVNDIFTVLIPEGSKNGQSLYLDDVPKTVVKVPVNERKIPIGPGLDEWIDGQGPKPFNDYHDAQDSQGGD